MANFEVDRVDYHKNWRQIFSKLHLHRLFFHELIKLQTERAKLDFFKTYYLFLIIFK